MAQGQEFSEDRDSGRMSIGTLTQLRWVAVFGQAITLLVVDGIFRLAEWVVAPLGVVGLALCMNVVAIGIYRRGERLPQAAVTWQLCFDVLQLSLLLYLTGGLTNPFSLFLVAPAAVGATALSRRYLAVLIILTLAAGSFLSVFHQPLPWPDGSFQLPVLFRMAVWGAMVIATLFLGIFLWRLAEENRRMASALAIAESALAGEQRVSAVGALAAAVVHELATPLGTINLVAHEIVEELPEDSPLIDEAETLLEQVERCRAILAHLGRRGEAAPEAAINRWPLSTLLAQAAEAQPPRAGIDLVFEAKPLPGCEDIPEPQALLTPGLLLALGNLIKNALRFAYNRVEVESAWTADEVLVHVRDDGPGFPASILARLGEPYQTSQGGDGHMGLGVFIARTLLERSGARLSFGERPGGGASVTVYWRRQDLESAATDSGRA